MAAWNENLEYFLGPTPEETLKSFEFFGRQNCEPWQRLAEAAVELRWYSPNATPTSAQFRNLIWSVLQQSKRWVGNYGVDRVVRLLP